MNKPSRPRHPDHVRRTNRPSPDKEVIQERLKSLLTPAVFGQLAYYRWGKAPYRSQAMNRIFNLLVVIALNVEKLVRYAPLERPKRALAV